MYHNQFNMNIHTSKVKVPNKHIYVCIVYPLNGDYKIEAMQDNFEGIYTTGQGLKGGARNTLIVVELVMGASYRTTYNYCGRTRNGGKLQDNIHLLCWNS